ncbi:Protein kinase C-binding protein 1-like [Oopsacas minuta]|uniref:Protein kinase C-binding protein 1-like n=1 Tax=Oopsacas minuta TaxID=111878 RepID=A0AAV7JVL5_9METZ|nr:Protein kinase C-binding protein 1-like [Oopsacas minuta]
MSVTTPTGLSSSNKDKSRRKRQNPMKLDVSVNQNSPTSIDLSNPALTPTEPTSIPVFQSDSGDDTPEPLEPTATPVTPIFTPTLSSQSQTVITPTPMTFEADDQPVNATNTTTVLPPSLFTQPIDTSISIAPDQNLNNSTSDTNATIISECTSKTSIKTEHRPVLNKRVISVNITKGSSFTKDSLNQPRKSQFSSRHEDISLSGQDTQKNDSYCWSCHEGGNVVCCDTCPRVFHLKCAHIDTDPPEDREWLCPICTRLRSSKRRKGETPANLSELLGFVMKKLKFEGTEQFQQEVKEEIAPGYRDLVYHPMDLCKIERNISSYETTIHLRYEVEWLLHNCIIYNGNKHALTKIAKQIVKLCRLELSEIEYCANCYKLSCLPNTGRFSQLCDPPHSIVMAEHREMRGHPLWPGKLINKARERCEIRFFGKKHCRVTVPVTCVKPLGNVEIPMPPPANKIATNWPEAISELKLYQTNLRQWLSAHPSYKMIVPEINDSAVFSPPNDKLNSSEENVGDISFVVNKVMKNLDENPPRPAVLFPPTDQFQSNIFFPNSDPTPIALFASNSSTVPPISRITNNDIDSGISKFPISDTKRVHLKDHSIIKMGTDGPLPHLLSETASEDENDDPSFKMNQKHPGRRKRPGPGMDLKQKNKKLVFSGVPTRVLPSSRGRGKKTDLSSRKLLHYQFPPDNLNDELRSTLKRELIPIIQEVPSPNVEPVNELMEKNLNVALKHFETKSIEENEEEQSQSKYYRMFMEKFDTLMLDIIADLNSGQIEHIQKILDDIVAREYSNRKQIYHQVYDNVREDMQRLIEQCHEVAKIEVERQSNEIQRQCDIRLVERVRDAKKKTWCSYCWDEAYYNCCWNVNYCSEKCQKIHWPEHKPNCIQMLNSPAPAETQVASEPRQVPGPSSREREEDQTMDVVFKKSHYTLPDPEKTIHKRKLSVDIIKETMKQEEPYQPHSLIPVERERHPDQNPHHRFTAPSSAHTLPTSFPHLEKSKIDSYPSVIPPALLNSNYLNHHKTTPPPTCGASGDTSTATTPVYVKAPNISISTSSGLMTHKEHLDQFSRGVRYAPMSGSGPHQSPRGQPAPLSVPLGSALSQMETNNPNSNVTSRSILPSSGQLKEPHGNHPTPPTPHKRVRETVPNRAGAQSPHPSVNPVMFSSPTIDGHGSQPTSFIIHPGGPPVPGAPTTPTSNQAKVLQQPFHPNIGPHNLYQLMNGDVSRNFMMPYPYPPPPAQIIQNQGTLQPNPHTMTPRPHDL